MKKRQIIIADSFKSELIVLPHQIIIKSINRLLNIFKKKHTKVMYVRFQPNKR